jgi:hypothetical protein
MVSASKHKWRTFCLCISGAIIFWLLNALNKVYTTEIYHPVLFIMDESKVALAKLPPSPIRLEVTGNGWRLLRYLLRLNVQPVKIPVAQVLKRGQIRSERLRFIFAKKLKDVAVRDVWLDEAHYVHKPSQK